MVEEKFELEEQAWLLWLFHRLIKRRSDASTVEQPDSPPFIRKEPIPISRHNNHSGAAESRFLIIIVLMFCK